MGNPPLPPGIPPPPPYAPPVPPPYVPAAPAAPAAPPPAPPVAGTRPAGPDVVLTPVRQRGRLLRAAPWGLLVLTLLATAAVVLGDVNLVTVLLLVACALGMVGTWVAAYLRPGPRVSITRGVLLVTTADDRRVFDLTNPATRLTVVGHPEARTWRVEIARHRLPPYVLDASLVDPHELTAAIWPYVPAYGGHASPPSPRR